MAACILAKDQGTMSTRVLILDRRLAGLAMGFGRYRDEIRRAWKVGKRFEPGCGERSGRMMADVAGSAVP